MQIDVADIEEFIPYASLIGLNSWYIMKFCESRVLHKYRPPHINNSSVSDNPDIAIPVEYFVEHDEKKHKYIRLKEPQKWWTEYLWIPPMIDSITHGTYREYQPEKNIWKSCEKVSMKNRTNLISFTEIAFKKIVMHRRHDYILFRLRIFQPCPRFVWYFFCKKYPKAFKGTRTRYRPGSSMNLFSSRSDSDSPKNLFLFSWYDVWFYPFFRSYLPINCNSASRGDVRIGYSWS